MKKVLLVVLLGTWLVIPAAAQTGQQTSPKDPMATWLRNAYSTNRNYIRRSAEKVPEELYGLRPGPQVEVRTFGQILGHLANFNYLWCSQAKGEKNPNQGNDFEKLTSKAALVRALSDAFTYCDSAYTALTDASGVEIISVTQENGRQAQVPRMSLLVLNYGHNNEHYGNLVTYMRIKSIVPASSEPRPQQPQTQP
ncbi:MAG: DinB family protein [Acidobacteriia bacterium]|nr:DinB family protein [Terriglobia bacterium]